ncbi:MAG: hypothetical protein JO354_14425 [Verrucomicrobia bacterium]|nr:hypothetical protein [Verrucomicrobiota bacterium]
MPSIRTSRYFSRLPDLDVSKFAGKVITGLTGNPEMKDPPVSPAELGKLKKAFDDAIIAATAGGTLATAQKEAARAILVAALNKDASYVDINCDEDLTVLLATGFEPVSNNRGQTVLSPPEIIGAEYGQSGEVRLRVKGDSNRRAIQGRCKAVGGEFGPTINFRNSRAIMFSGLKAGTTYVMQLCGLGGSTGQSDWSEPVTKIAL